MNIYNPGVRTIPTVPQEKNRRVFVPLSLSLSLNSLMKFSFWRGIIKKNFIPVA